MNQLPIAPMITAYQRISNISFIANPKPATSSAFKLYSKKWKNSVFEEYTGSYEAVQSSCPKCVKITLWITALAIKILELKMLEKKDLWELVAQKSRKYIHAKLNQDIKERFSLLAKAEEYIMSC